GVRIDRRVRRCVGGNDYLAASIRINFKRPVTPLLMETADFRQLNRLATSAISSSLALPSIGADLTCASHPPSAVCSSALKRELGLTFTRISIGAAAIGEVNQMNR